MTKTIDYFFSIGSPWSHIGFDGLVDLATRHGAEIRPFLTTVVEENGAYSREIGRMHAVPMAHETSNAGPVCEGNHCFWKTGRRSVIRRQHH